MAIGDTKKDVKLGKTRYENIKNTDDNFASLFDTVDDLNTAIDGKEPKFTKKTAFNVDFNDIDGNLSMDGERFAGTLNSVARADHRHPTDTTRLAAKPDGSNLLIVSNKINTAYLPDTILGQLYYKGVWAPSSGGTSPTSPDAATTSPQKGDYYIAGNSGNYNPEKKTVSGVSYSTGDWAVYNGNSWDKVDNTDAVMMVNGQIGAVKTYKGAYSDDVTYYNGDIVLSDDCLYLCIAASTSKGVAPTDTTNWKIFGKIYDSLKNPFGLRLMLNGSNYDYNGSTAVTVEITPAAIGAATSGHTHSYLPLSGGTITGNVTFNAGKALQLNTLKLPTASGGTTYGAGSSGQVLKSNGTTVYWGTDTNTDTKNTAGSTDTSSKIFLIGATSQAANPQTYSHDTAYVGTDGCLYSGGTKVSVNGHTHSAATTSSSGFLSSTDKSKLDGIAAGAQVNQKAFSQFKVGTTEIKADTETDILTLVAGDNVTLTPDATNDRITIAAKDTTYTSLPNPNGLRVQVNGDGASEVRYDGSAAKTINIKAGSNVTITSDSSGNITISSTASAGSVTGDVGTVVYEATSGGLYCDSNTANNGNNSVAIEDSSYKYKRLRFYCKGYFGLVCTDMPLDRECDAYVTDNDKGKRYGGVIFPTAENGNIDSTGIGPSSHMYYELKWRVEKEAAGWRVRVVDSGWLGFNAGITSNANYTGNSSAAVAGTNYISWNQRHNNGYCIYKIVAYTD